MQNCFVISLRHGCSRLASAPLFLPLPLPLLRLYLPRYLCYFFSSCDLLGPTFISYVPFVPVSLSFRCRWFLFFFGFSCGSLSFICSLVSPFKTKLNSSNRGWKYCCIHQGIVCGRRGKLLPTLRCSKCRLKYVFISGELNSLALSGNQSTQVAVRNELISAVRLNERK